MTDPASIHELQRRWSLTLGPAVTSPDVHNSWVAPAVRADGSLAMLKIGLPHFEAAHEIAGLRFWDGDPSVRLLEADESRWALLLERCEPDVPLSSRPEPEQDVVIARLLARAWRLPDPPHPFRPLSTMVSRWSDEARSRSLDSQDVRLVEDGLRVFHELSQPRPDDVLLLTDLHAGNVLSARRMEWLAIDPKPFVGDRAYDATQHLLNCRERLNVRPLETIRRLADLLAVNESRVRLWLFARAAAGPRDDWSDAFLMRLARALAP